MTVKKVCIFSSSAPGLQGSHSAYELLQTFVKEFTSRHLEFVYGILFIFQVKQYFNCFQMKVTLIKQLWQRWSLLYYFFFNLQILIKLIMIKGAENPGQSKPIWKSNQIFFIFFRENWTKTKSPEVLDSHQKKCKKIMKKTIVKRTQSFLTAFLTTMKKKFWKF